MDGGNSKAAADRMPLKASLLELDEAEEEEEEGRKDETQEEDEGDESGEGEEEEEEEEEDGEEQIDENALEDGTEEHIDEVDEQEHAVPASKRRRLQPRQRRPPRMAIGGGAARKKTSQPRHVKPLLAWPSTLTSTDRVLVPSIQLQTPIPVEVLLHGLTACMRSASRQSEPAQAALFDALYGIRMELEDRISDGHKMDITYYKQAKRNDERQPTALVARKMERPRAAQVLRDLLTKWKTVPASVSTAR